MKIIKKNVIKTQLEQEDHIYIYSHSDDLWILNFPTKKHWRNKSEIEWIEAGLKYFSNNYSKVEIKSVAFPKLGTNNGGLDWNNFKGIGKKSYEKLFRYYYQLVKGNKRELVQMPLEM